MSADEPIRPGEAGDGAGRRQRSRPALPEHLRRRRRLLAWSAPVVLAFLVTGSLLLGTALGNHLGAREYEAQRFDQAATQYQAQQRWTGFAEQWKAWFNSGTAQYRAEEHFLATEDLRAALDRVPEAGPLPGGPEGSKAPESPECRVRTNLSLAIEAMGDVAASAEDSGMAAAYYEEAQGVIDPCTASQENEESSDRQEEKEDEARSDDEPTEDPADEPTEDPTEDPSAEPTEDPNGDATEDPSAEPTDEPTGEPTEDPNADATEEPTEEPTPSEPADDPQREELEERNREAERDRQEQQERGGGGYGGGQNW